MWAGKKGEVGGGVQGRRRGGRDISQFIKVMTTGTSSFTIEVLDAETTRVRVEKRKKW